MQLLDPDGMCVGVAGQGPVIGAASLSRPLHARDWGGQPTKEDPATGLIQHVEVWQACGRSFLLRLCSLKIIPLACRHTHASGPRLAYHPPHATTGRQVDRPIIFLLSSAIERWPPRCPLARPPTSWPPPGPVLILQPCSYRARRAVYLGCEDSQSPIGPLSLPSSSRQVARAKSPRLHKAQSGHQRGPRGSPAWNPRCSTRHLQRGLLGPAGPARPAGPQAGALSPGVEVGGCNGLAGRRGQLGAGLQLAGCR